MGAVVVSRAAVYLAGPEVFLPDAAEIGAAKLAICAKHGLDARYPGEASVVLDDDGLRRPAQRAAALYDALIAQLDGCAAVIANLTPFRGPSADAGTVWEVGYALGRGLPVFAYTNHPLHYGERVEPDGLLVEAFDLADNLMIDEGIRRGGGIVERHDGGPDPVAALRDLTAFERCVAASAVAVGATRIGPTR